MKGFAEGVVKSRAAPLGEVAAPDNGGSEGPHEEGNIALAPSQSLSRKPNPPTAEEIKALLAWCSNNDPLLLDLVTIAVNTGLPRNDILSITGENIDLDLRLLKITTPKKGKEYYVPLNNAVRKVLAERKSLGYIFPLNEIKPKGYAFRRKVLGVLRDAGKPLTGAEVANEMGEKRKRIHNILLAMARCGKREIERLEGGKYTVRGNGVDAPAEIDDIPRKDFSRRWQKAQRTVPFGCSFNELRYTYAVLGLDLEIIHKERRKAEVRSTKFNKQRICQLYREKVMVDRCRASDEEAWRELVKKYRNKIYSIVRPVAKGAAEDAVQETFLRLFRSFDTYRFVFGKGTRLSNWIYIIARYAALDVAKKQGIVWEFVEDCTQWNPGNNPEGLATRHEAGAITQKALRSVRPDYRKALKLYYLKGNSYKQIAEILGIPYSTIGSRVDRGRKELLASLQQTGVADELAREMQ